MDIKISAKYTWLRFIMPRKRLIHTEYIVCIRTLSVRSGKLSKPIYEGIRKAINAAAQKALREYIQEGKLDCTFTADTR